MSTLDFTEVFLSFAAIFVLTPIIGKYMTRVYQGEFTLFLKIEKLFYKFTGIDSHKEMNWISYTSNVLIFNFIGLLFVMALLMAQGVLPLNPQHFPGLSFVDRKD